MNTSTFKGSQGEALDPIKPALGRSNMRETPSILLFVETSREFGRSLLSGIARYSRLHGPWRVYRQPAGLDSLPPDFKDWNIDGAIVRDVKMFERLAVSNFPVIFAQHNRENYAFFPAIITDSYSIGRMGAEHFFDRGFQDFAYCGLDDYIWSRERGRYFKERVEQEGLNVYIYKQPRFRQRRTEGRNIHGKPTADGGFESGFAAAKGGLSEWLKSLPKPVALMCCNDDRALQIVEACKVSNLSVPDEVAVLGVDNDVLVCDLADPPISSIALSTEAAGYEAAALLDRLIKGEKMSGQKIMVFPTRIVTRLSTDILAVTDPEVAAAVRFIRQHADLFIQVDNVVEATKISRRLLEKRFRATLKRSIYQEIRRFRVNHIIQLLLGTDMSMTDIALSSGFNGVEHISRYFRKEVGMSPREYRKKYAPR